MTVAHSKTVRVSKHHLTLIWPVFLKGEPPPLPGEPADKWRMARWAQWFQKNDDNWKDPLASWGWDNVTPVPDEYRYEEIVYFHPFVRDFLFGDGGTEKRDLAARFLYRTDVKKVRVDMDGFCRELAVSRVQLHLMKPCVAILCVEVEAEDFTLWDLQRFQDRFRRIYPPFWAGGEPGLAPRSIEWLGSEDRQLCRSDVTATEAAFRKFTQVGAEPPVCDHWQFFFGKLDPFQRRRTEEKLCYQQLTDERIPTMSYFAVPDPALLSEGDYDRITFLDDPNDSDAPDTYPYNPDFLRATRHLYRYTRFSHYGTTYLCSGYGFSVVGPDVGPHASFFTNILRHHFRHHYFRMGLMAHYQRAALLYFADELSGANKDHAGKHPGEELRDPRFREHVERVQMQFLKFRSRAYFPEVSNQLQGQELWQLWFDRLNSRTLFDLVDTTSERLTSVLAEYHSRELSREQAEENKEMKKLAHEQSRLANIAKLGLIVSIVLSAVSAFFAWVSLYPDEVKGKFSLEGDLLWGPVIWLGLAGCTARIVWKGISKRFDASALNSAVPPSNS